ncbi:MAG: hypothetical protein ACXAC5_05035 [Promethearchaeota archaeon]|jgi:hypothetical protein
MTDRDKVIKLLDDLGIGYDLDTSCGTIWIEDHHAKVEGLTEYSSIAFTFCSKDESFKELVMEND